MREGKLIANAPHMPVHLGSMGEIDQDRDRAQPGRCSRATSTCSTTPTTAARTCPTSPSSRRCTWTRGDAKPCFYVASRGHHADIGGITPGSMPPFSKTIDEEGVLFDNFLLVRDGRLREAELRALLTPARYPARNPRQNIADLRAQIAANEKGVQELRAMVDAVRPRHGGRLHAARAGQRRGVGAARDHRAEGRRTSRLTLDNGAVIRVAGHRRTPNAREATIDFTGTSAQLPNNFNAPKAVTMAAVLYVFRTLVDDDIPLNAGCLKPLQVIVPEGCMLNPRPPAAVVAGNVETSQCVTNALYGALGVMAASQGTMNNFTFGNEHLPVLRDDLRRLGRRARLRRHQRRADPHDQLAAHRPRGAGVPLPGAAGELRDPRGLGRRRALPRRRRRRAARALPRADDGVDPQQRPPRAGRSAWPAASRARWASTASSAPTAASRRCSTSARREMQPGDVFVIETPGGGGYGAAGS